MEFKTNGEPSLGDLVGDLAREARELVRHELDLAKCELTQKTADLRRGAASMAVGGLLGHVGLLCLAAAAVAGLAVLFLSQGWIENPAGATALSAAIVGVVLGIAGWALVASGRRAFQPRHFVPERTVEAMKENSRWVREKVS